MGRSLRRGRPFVLALAVSVCAAPSSAAVLEVGGPASTYDSIQNAIDDATPGVDSVFVHCGTYAENLSMRDGVDVVGAGAACTVVDGGGAGSVVTAFDIGSSTVIEGLTLRNGVAAQGGGLFVEASALTVRGNVIESNQAVGSTFPDGAGGGIRIQTTFNRAFTEPSIVGNVIRGNSAGTFGGGISIDTDDGSTVTDNLIVGNQAGLAGGGMDIFESFPAVVNNTIARNCIQNGGSTCSLGGGGLSLTGSGVVPIYNNLVAWNEAAAGGGGVDSAGGSVLDLRNNDAFGNIPVNYAGLTDPTGTAGNIAADPLLVDERADPRGFQPRSDSPLIDGGTSSSAPAFDLRGIPHALDGDADGIALPDIGARENEGASRLAFASPVDLVWDASIDPGATFNLYRGDLAALRSSGVYVQDPGTVTDAARTCGLTAPAATDTDLPAGGVAWFYLATVAGSAEGSLGFDDVPAERPTSAGNACP